MHTARRQLGRYVFLILEFALLLAISASAETSDSRPELTVGYTEFRPYSYTDSNGAAQGYSIDILRTLSYRLGYRPTFVSQQNPEQLLNALQDNSVAVTSLLATTSERIAVGNFTDTLGRFDTSIFMLRTSDIAQQDDLAGLRVASIAGSYGATVVTERTLGTLVEFRSYPDLVVALLDGSVDAAIAPTEMLLSFLRRLGVDQRIKILDPAVSSSPRAFLIHPDRADLLADFNAAIGELAPQELTALHERWFGTPTKSSPLWLWIVGAVGSAGFVAGLVVWRLRKRERRMWADMQQNALLVDALNKIDLSIMIHDASGRCVHWNDAMSASFPTLVPLLESGACMADLITYLHTSGLLLNCLTEDKARQHAQDIDGKMRAGQDTTRMVHTADGRVFEAREIRIGDALFASVRTDVTKLERQAEQIRLQHAALAESYDRLQRFSALAAHDLRAPLNQQSTLLNFIFEDLLAEGFEPSSETKSLIDDARGTVIRMRGLIEDLLEYSRVTSLRGEAEDVRINDVLDDVLPLIDVPAGFKVEVDVGLPMLHVSKAGCGVVLRNLVSNALLHHDKTGGTVWITAQQHDQHVIVDVTDDGPGVPAPSRRRIFEPFERLSGSTGSGLGLAMVASSVEGWGGEISVLDRPGGGSIFRLTAPRASACAPSLSGGENVVRFSKIA